MPEQHNSTVPTRKQLAYPHAAWDPSTPCTCFRSGRSGVGCSSAAVAARLLLSQGTLAAPRRARCTGSPFPAAGLGPRSSAAACPKTLLLPLLAPLPASGQASSAAAVAASSGAVATRRLGGKSSAAQAWKDCSAASSHKSAFEPTSTSATAIWSASSWCAWHAGAAAPPANCVTSTCRGGKHEARRAWEAGRPASARQPALARQGRPPTAPHLPPALQCSPGTPLAGAPARDPGARPAAFQAGLPGAPDPKAR